MREIKFRGWWEGRWHYWGFMEDDQGNPRYYGPPQEVQDDPRGGLLEAFAERSQQWTGLRDKGGREIYEGDILVWPHLKGDTPKVVVWVPGECCFAADGPDGKPDSWLDEKCEVIGNIYENPELLEAPK